MMKMLHIKERKAEKIEYNLKCTRKICCGIWNDLRLWPGKPRCLPFCYRCPTLLAWKTLTARLRQNIVTSVKIFKTERHQECSQCRQRLKENRKYWQCKRHLLAENDDF